MSSLKSRLDALRQQGGASGPAGAADPSIHQRLERLRCGTAPPRGQRGRPDPEALAEAVGGVVEPGGFVRVERFVPWGTGHGGQTLRPLPALEHLPGMYGLEASQWVFLDTETSGLAGGTGTVPFLCGFARFGHSGLHLSQFMLGGFGAEAAMLRALMDEIGPAPTLATYNGKSFDLPLLRDRVRLQGIGASLGETGHLDLLHPVRRAFASRWPDCRLATVESRLLDYARIDDLPGAEVPDVWFSYLHRGATTRMADVVRHNQDDLISLAQIPPRLDAAYADPRAHGADIRQVAAAHAGAGETSRAFELLARFADTLCRAGQLDLADHLRRRGDWERACAIWERLAEHGCVEALERLAKYHEHVRRDWRRALVFACRLPDDVGRSRRVARLYAKAGVAP
ncbi:ribonuclease H-like domain-containing protein [Ectothiorhodospiraceae bacterium WFHF3C12]|nr:ribonuclease H-like domain-containing protein [Ectothiorhodospiraceae bacterium WFHF3C12]